MQVGIYEALITQRMREAHSRAREARLARALRASRRADRAVKAAEAAQERAVPVPRPG